MVEKLTESEMIMPYVMGQKINELIEEFNNHAHDTLADYGFGHPRRIKEKPSVQKESPPS